MIQTGTCQCVACGYRGSVTDLPRLLDEITDWPSRVKPGDEVPIGQCDCGALATLIKDTTIDYDYNQVMTIIHGKFGKHHGALTLWVEYNAQLRSKDYRVARITLGLLQAWRRADHYPIWAVQQLIAMPVTQRPSPHRWSEDEVEYLRELYLDDPSRSDDKLAQLCAQEFGRPVGDNSIKSKLHTLRKAKRVTFRKARVTTCRTLTIGAQQ